jgi:hypothetical protein
MRGLATLGLAIALGLGSVGAARADDDSDSSGTAKPSSNPLGFHWSPVFVHAVGWDQEQNAPKRPAPKPKKPPVKKEEAKKPTVVDQSTLARAREEASLLRRLAVCDKLREIAIRTNDGELLRRVDALDERARMTYSVHTTVSQGAPKEFDLDEKILDEHLGMSAAANPGADKAISYSVNSAEAVGTAPAREEKR